MKWQRHWTRFMGHSIFYRDDDLFAVAPTDWDGLPNSNVSVFLSPEQAMEEFERRADAAIREFAEGEKVAYVESGRDCDCVEYDGRIHLVQASYAAYCELDREIAEWADGPFHLRIIRPSEARSVVGSQRDLALEAYEDGHPHYIVSQFG